MPKSRTCSGYFSWKGSMITTRSPGRPRAPKVALNPPVAPSAIVISLSGSGRKQIEASAYSATAWRSAARGGPRWRNRAPDQCHRIRLPGGSSGESEFQLPPQPPLAARVEQCLHCPTFSIVHIVYRHFFVVSNLIVLDHQHIAQITELLPQRRAAIYSL